MLVARHQCRPSHLTRPSHSCTQKPHLRRMFCSFSLSAAIFGPIPDHTSAILICPPGLAGTLPPSSSPLPSMSWPKGFAESGDPEGVRWRPDSLHETTETRKRRKKGSKSRRQPLEPHTKPPHTRIVGQACVMTRTPYRTYTHAVRILAAARTCAAHVPLQGRAAPKQQGHASCRRG